MPNKALYEKIKGYLGDKYQESDGELITLYCETHAFHQRILDELNKTGLMVPYTNNAGKESLVKNPLTIEITKITQVLNNLLKSLGLTTAQRKEIMKSNKTDEFEEF